MSDDEKKEEKKSPLLLVIILLIIGAIEIMLGAVYYFVHYSVITAMPAWWPFTGSATATFEAVLGGDFAIPIGVWMFIAAFGLLRERAWAIGVLFVCFTVILVGSAVSVIKAIVADPADFVKVWADWVAIILIAIAAIGFIYLLATHKRYH